MNVILPPALTQEARIAIISPAGPIETKRLKAGIRQLEVWGFRPQLMKSTGGKKGYLAASDEERLADLITAFSDDSIDAVYCARGGYGSGRLLEKVPFELIRNNPKPFIGFSDVTALNWAIFAKTGLVTFSGPTIREIGKSVPDETLNIFRTVLGLDQFNGQIHPVNFRLLKPGTAEGKLFPGCLSIIVTLLGTRFLPDLSGAILLIEDVAEKPYRIDRMLTHMKNAGVFSQISGLIIGSMVDCWTDKRSTDHLNLEDILLDLTSEYDFPIALGFPYGHHINRVTLPIGTDAELTDEGLEILQVPHL